MNEFWPWWLGAITLGGLTLGFWAIMGRLMGVSGSWSRLVNRREEQMLAQAESPFRQDPSAIEDALLAATLAEFGDGAVQTMAAKPAPAGARRRSNVGTRTPWGAHLTFLFMMVVGGMVASMSTGEYQFQLDLGATHTRFFGADWQTWMVLLAGGGLVGFGTQMAGGCTSGHGLSGCSRLVPASLVATAAFFGTAVGVSLLLEVIAK